MDAQENSQDGQGGEDSDRQEDTKDETEESQEVRCEPFGGHEEGQAQKVARDPGTPAQAEREEHEVTHWPYRAWCDHCVNGRGKDAQKRKSLAKLKTHRSRE